MSTQALAQAGKYGRFSLRMPRAEVVGAVARRGAIWSVLLVVARQPIGLISTAVLSRLLSPDEYGLIGMVAILTAFLQAFADMGLSMATVRRESLTRAQVDGLFWINAAVGMLLWAASALSGPALAAFFGREELAGLAAAMGATFALGGLAAQPAALLARQFRSRAIFGVETAACLVGAAAAIGLALMGFGYWALVWQALATQFVRLVMVMAVTGYWPCRPRADVEIGGLLAFGGYITAYALVSYVGRNLDNIVIGRVWGSAALGYYARAYFLMSMPMMLASSALSGVMIPALSALGQDRERLGKAYRQASLAIALIGLPVAGFLFVAAPEVVRLLYGDRWVAVVPLLRWLSLAGMAQTLVASSGWLYVALGRGRALLLVGIGLTAIHSVAIVIGNRWGPQGVAVSYTLTSVALGLPSLWVAHRIASIRLSETLRAISPVVVATAAAMAVGFAGGEVAFRMTNSWSLRLTAEIVAGAFTFLAGGGRLIKELASGALAGMSHRSSGGA